MSVGRMFKKSFKSLGCIVIDAGYFTGGSIPWPSAPDLSRYADPPVIPVAEDQTLYNLIPLYQYACKQFGPPDFVLEVDAGCFFKREEQIPCPLVTIGSDPHALQYNIQREQSNIFFSMQKFYMKETDEWLPYAFDPDYHYWANLGNDEYDLCFIGVLSTEQRKRAMEYLSSRFKCFIKTGILFEEANEIYNRSLVGFNLSSQQDLPMRFWEDLARRNLVITSRVPDLQELSCKEDVHYVAYSTPAELAEKVEFYRNHRNLADRISTAGWIWIHDNGHTYQDRAVRILRSLKLWD